MPAARRRNRRDRLAQSMGSAPEPRRRGWVVPFLVGVAATAAVFLATRSAPTSSNIGSEALTAASLGPDRPKLAELSAMSGDELTGHDIALVNLRCAEGLPGSESLDITACLRTLNEWAQRVRAETERHLYRAHDPKYAQHYRNSEAFLRASMMIQVLQEDCGVHYNKDRIREIDFTKSQDLFIHGMIGRANGGTCVSMPVLYTAIGRRLGYPIHLVTAKAHLFCRWDDGKERFNIEGAGEGFSAFDDAHYMNWPKPISETEVKAGQYLKSLSRGEELAVFLAARGHCLEDNGRPDEARVCYAQALQRQPNSADYFGFLVQSLGFRQRPDFQAAAKRQPIEPPLVYRNNFDPYANSQPRIQQGMGWPQPHTAAQPHNVFKPQVPTVGVPAGFANPAANSDFGLLE